jgi:lysozyme
MSLETSITNHEEYRAKPYLDTKKLWTFGIGRCLETNPLTTGEWKYLLDHGHLALSLSRPGADWLMEQQIVATRGQCARMLDFWPKLNEVRQDVIVEMAFQMSLQKVLAFHDLLQAIRDERWTAAKEAGLDSKWAKADSPKRAKELMDRFERGA